MGDEGPDKGELTRRLVRAIELLSLDEALRIFAADVEVTTILERWITLPRLRGHDGVRLWFEQLDGFWAFSKVERWSHEEIGDWVLVSGHSRVRGKASPEEFELPWFAAGRLSDEGKVDVLGIYLTREEARELIEGYAG